MSLDPDIRHIVAEQAYWSGRVTTVCGAIAESGEYEMHYFFAFGPLCSECKRLSRDRDT